ncbi:unnamed protein product [Nippostrongylus brasiliensis]|uniref:G_PROTEIN_RECEP_F1_2 domain-containing protein n=1 Tax=Nippostrongylus brasiliensis TaxID=27835 RepID=A0A0N4XWF0_NIPBR|nr:unnamed protein product [Nippostrongylus brasiliensis]
MFSAPCVIVLIPTVVNLVLTLNDDSPVSALCLTKEALNPGFHDYMLLMRIISCIGSGMVYGYIALRLKQHFAKHGIQVMGNVKVETNQLRNIRHSTITVGVPGLTTINALVFLLIPDLLALFDLGGFYDNYPTILYSFYCINVNVNFFILVTRHKEIRQNFAYFVQVLLLRQQAGKANQPSNTTRIGGVSNMMKRSCTPAVA